MLWDDSILADNFTPKPVNCLHEIQMYLHLIHLIVKRDKLGLWILFLRGTYILCICAHISMCTTCGPRARGEQTTAADPLEPELQMFMNCHVGAGNQSWLLC